ncbi:MAG: FAD-binding protein, partial [Mycobacterium sp.]
SEVKAGRGSPHGGVYLDIASRLTPAQIKRRLPSMYHQFMQLADVDITKHVMEVGPTCHYVMGGIEVDADTGASTVAGLFAAGECSGGMHGSNRLGGNSLSDLLVFGRRAGLGVADYVQQLSSRPAVPEDAVGAAAKLALAPFDGPSGPSGSAEPENPYTLHGELQQSMNDLVGIIRNAHDIEQALAKLEEFKARFANLAVEGHRQYNPGWHLAVDLRNMLLVGECVTKAALQRTESRGGHTRDDHPSMDSSWRKLLLVCEAAAGDEVIPDITITKKDQTPMRSDLLELFEIAELEKYYTDEELAGHPGRTPRTEK